MPERSVVVTRPRWSLSSRELAVGLLFVAVAALACLVGPQSDTFWQLRTGFDIWETGQVTFVEPYSHTAPGAYWPNHEWLSEVLFALTYWVGGMPLLAAFCAVALVGAYALSWRLMSGRFEVAFGVFALALVDTGGAWSMRPQIITLFCFMATCTLLVRNRIAWLPVLFLCWANLHAGVALGLVAVAAAVVADVLATGRPPWRLAGIAMLCLGATVFTPMGVGLWRLLIEYSQRAKTQGIAEWMPPGLPPEYFSFWLAALLLVGATLVFWRRAGRETKRLTAIALAVLPLALGAHRNVSVFLLVAAPALSGLLSSRLPGRGHAADYRRGNTVVLGLAAVAAGAFVALTWMRPPTSLNWRPLGDQTIGAIKACRPPVYNSLGLGGLLIWFTPDQPVFIDNRNDPYPVELLDANLHAEQTGNFASLFARHDVRCAVVEPGSRLDEALRAAEEWNQVETDGGANVYVDVAP